MEKTSKDHWGALRKAVRDLKPTGHRGFEELCARLFQAETGEPFYLARTGDQPVGDAYSPSAGISIQAKHYTTGKISENNVEGDIGRLLRESPQTDIFLVVALRADSQLKLRLERLTEETGVDIELLAFDDTSSPLGSLCIVHWNIIREFFPKIRGVEQWIKSQSSSADVIAHRGRLKLVLSGCATKRAVLNQAKHKLSIRFSGGILGSRRHNCVDISNAVSRCKAQKALSDWLNQSIPPIAVIEGEEGIGKTWIAAEFASTRVPSHVVLWLDSVDWGGASAITDVLQAGLEKLYVRGDVRIARIIKKILHRWNGAVIIILDGANERNAWTAADRVIRDYEQHPNEFKDRIRLVFTSRPLDAYSTVPANLWDAAQIIEAKPFDDVELTLALAKFAPEVEMQMFTPAVRPLARVPRYLRLCIQLRERLASLGHITREILLWADLEAKLKSGDPQWQLVRGYVDAKPEEILAHLAKEIGWPRDATTSVETNEIQQYLPNFSKVRADLMDQRIVLSSDLSKTSLSSEHIILGWGLALHGMCVKHSEDGADDLYDRLERALEPAASNDDKARAVHVAALLAFMQEGSSSAVAREALFRIWAAHHNTTISSEALAFFLRKDFRGYIRAVEAFFRTHIPGYFETTLIAPLAIQWRDHGDEHPILQETLERWLRLIFPGDATGSEDKAKTPPPYLVPAASHEQLRLSYAAVGIISFRPSLKLLPSLLECYQSCDFCYADINHPTISRRIRFKSSSEGLGVLLRWHYGEVGLKELANAAGRAPLGAKTPELLHWFAKQWRMAELPTQLGVPKDTVQRSPEDDRETFTDVQEALSDPNGEKLNIFCVDLADRLAIRRDLPSLTHHEISSVSTKVEELLTYSKNKRFSNTWEEKVLGNLMPYLARYSPAHLQSVIQTLWRSAIPADDAVARILDIHQTLPPTDDEGQLVRTIMKWASLLKPSKEMTREPSAYTEVLLLHASTDVLIQWFDEISILKLSNGSPVVALQIFHFAVKRLAPMGLEEALKEKLEHALCELERAENDETKHLVNHWLHIYSYGVKTVSPDLGAWALELASRYSMERGFLYPLFLLVSRCSNKNILIQALLHPAFKENCYGYFASRWIKAFSENELPSFTWRELKNATSLTVAGWLLYASKNEVELLAWGRDFTVAALAGLSDLKSPPLRTHVLIEAGCDGQLQGMSFKTSLEGKETQVSISSPVWGVDRRASTSLPTQEERNHELETFHQDIEKSKALPDPDFVDFNAEGPLRRWAQIAPNEFIKWSQDFRARFSKSKLKESIGLQYLASTLEEELLRLNHPNQILGTTEGSLNTSHHPIRRYRGTVSSHLAALWKSQNNHLPSIRSGRNQWLICATNDEGILWNVLAAHAGGNSAEIAEMALEWLNVDSAQERALGVTLLAFHGDSHLLPKLKSIRETDPSFWVREHARWAIDACATEASARKRYEELLAARTLEEVVAGFAELRPALSPMAFTWGYSEKNRSLLAEQTNRNRAVIELFWYHIGNSSELKERVNIAGRQLRDFCRGERLKDGITNKMAPWWDPA